MEILTTAQVIDSIPGSICPGGDASRAVELCGANCPDKDAATYALRAAGVSVEQNGCHGSRGGCSQAGELSQGTYATVQQRTETGLRAQEVIININR